jgi:hypothetical protein
MVTAAASALTACLSVVAQNAATVSPFIPAGQVATPTGQSEGYELVGVIRSGKDTMVGITNTQENKSLWIPLGKTKDGIEVVSHNPQNDEVIVRVNGVLKTLSLRAATIKSGGSSMPVFASAPLPQVALKSLTTQAEQEREARMLVSDLLEIGMQQRKAYEEAQKKAAQGNPAPAAAPQSQSAKNH